MSKAKAKPAAVKPAAVKPAAVKPAKPAKPAAVKPAKPAAVKPAIEPAIVAKKARIVVSGRVSPIDSRRIDDEARKEIREWDDTQLVFGIGRIACIAARYGKKLSAAAIERELYWDRAIVQKIQFRADTLGMNRVKEIPADWPRENWYAGGRGQNEEKLILAALGEFYKIPE